MTIKHDFWCMANTAPGFCTCQHFKQEIQTSEQKHEEWLLRKQEERNEAKSDAMREARFEREMEAGE